jgi:cytochrome b6-f complex iron-sulfur subunit
VPSADRFECPCHGSKFTKEGDWIEGPAPRHLDRFVVQAVDGGGNVVAETPAGDPNVDPEAGSPIQVPPETVELRIDTGARVTGAQRS